MSLHKSRVAITVALALALLAGCSNPTATEPIPAPSSTSAIPANLKQYYGQEAKWVDCGGAQCTNVKVPLNYADPAGETFSLAVTKVPATGQSLGSLFVNPGGPGGSGFDYAKSASLSLSDAVTKHYDIVGVDPRGVSKSDPIYCLTDQQRDEVAAVDFSAQTPQDMAVLIATGKLPAQSCKTYANPEFTFMDTKNVARDFDVVREVVGDESFNYLGKSYGTAIGTDYAALFPQRVGRMVLDGVLPLDLGLEEITRGQAAGFEDAFMNFAEDCASKDDCPYKGDGKQVAQELRDFLTSLDAKPLPVGDRMLNESLASSAVLSFLYFPSRDYPRLRSALNSAVKENNGAPLLSLLDERSGRQVDGRYVDNSAEAFYAVTCLDRQYQATAEHVSDLAKQWEQLSPTFGAGMAWGLFPCANWPAKGTGPAKNVNIQGTAPILIVSTTNDPATPAMWGTELSKQIAGSGQLMWDAYNHTAYEQGSLCIDEAVDAYLLQGTMPSANAVCGG
ncbi:MAG: alpha/beta hydrolase [Actinomycetota bacterium]|nr:alpha/beta hydrolase [Actinomycetota bacterium]